MPASYIGKLVFNAVASSKDGKTWIAASSAYPPGIYTSADSGLTWVPVSALPTVLWSSVASSADGSRLVVSDWDGLIYTSSDSGGTWQKRAAVPAQRPALASSADGMKLALASEGGLFTSDDAGATWTQRTSAPLSWLSIASSDDGEHLVAARNSIQGSVFTSEDAGRTWIQRLTADAPLVSVASSADGARLVAAAHGSYIYVSDDFGSTWAERATPRSWSSVASSSDGSKLIAAVDGEGGALYTSEDFGATWTERVAPMVFNWWSVAASADGKRLMVGSAQMPFTSSDAGATWKMLPPPSTSYSTSALLVTSSVSGARQLFAMADGSTSRSSDFGSTWTGGWIASSSLMPHGLSSSADGARLAVTDWSTDQIYISTDAGVSWAARGPSQNWGVPAWSGDGSRLIVPLIGVGWQGSVPLASSLDAGVTWTIHDQPLDCWKAIACSFDGTRMVAAASYWSDSEGGTRFGRLYTSSDGGTVWTLRSAPSVAWSSVASSSDGSKLIATAKGDHIYSSFDCGATWIPRASVDNWSAVASSPDGTRLVATAFGGYIYTSEGPVP